MLAEAGLGRFDAAIHSGRMGIDAGLLAEGYLRSKCGRKTRHVPQLERLGRDAESLGVQLYWADLPGDLPGACDCRGRVILLAPWLFVADGEIVRQVLSHELGHILAGACEKRADRWGLRLYGNIIAASF